MNKFNMLTAGLLLAAIATPAAAVQSIFTTELRGANESPPNDSPATGNATVTIDTISGMMQVHESFSGLTSGNTASHIHCCTTDPGVGNAPVATTVPTFTDFPAGETTGTYDHTFNMLNASSYNTTNPDFIMAHGGTAKSAFDALLAGVNAGTAYANIHTSVHPGGEIRGFLAPIPEPETYAMFLAGLALMGALARRRRG
jgi:hypothetical protein